MNWGRAKTILIIMFLVTDVFLLIVLMQTHKQALVIPKQTIAETVKILSDNRIKVQSENIPAKRIKSRNMIMQNYFQVPDDAARRILGQELTAVKNLPEKYEYQYESTGGTLYIQGNGFSYQSNRVLVPYTVKQLPETKEVSTKIAEALDKLGFPKETVSLEAVLEQEGIYHCDAMPTFEGEKIYGISMHITADSEGVFSIEGHWFEPIKAEKNEPEFLMDVTAVLTGMALGNDEAYEITEISYGYYASDDFLNSREIAAIPIYVIKDHRGQLHMYDARVGVRVE